MTNPTAGFGLRAVRRLDGAALSFAIEERRIAYNNSNTWGTGDLVKNLSTGFIDAYTAGGSLVLGVFIGCKYFSAAVGRTIWVPNWSAPSLASTVVVTALVISDPNIVFDIRADDTTAVGIGDIGSNADVVVGTANVITGQSVALLDQSTIATTLTLPLRIVGFNTAPNNDNTLADNIVEVRLNTSVYQTAVGV